MAVIVEGTQSSTNAIRAQEALNVATNNLPKGIPPPKPAESFVYLYSVSRLSFRVEHALLGVIELKGCRDGQRYCQAYAPIRNQYPQIVPDVFSLGRDPYDYHDAKRIAQDICDASNPFLDQKVEDFGKSNPFYDTQFGTNYSKHGVFWSLNNPPTEDEIKFAEKRRDKNRAALIRKMDELYAANPAKAMAEVKPEHREALSAMGEERPWFKFLQSKTQCPNCGELIPNGRLYHRDTDGDLCVIGQEGWKAVVASGKRKKEDVPEEFRWFRTAGRPPKDEQVAQ